MCVCVLDDCDDNNVVLSLAAFAGIIFDASITKHIGNIIIPNAAESRGCVRRWIIILVVCWKSCVVVSSCGHHHCAFRGRIVVCSHEFFYSYSSYEANANPTF